MYEDSLKVENKIIDSTKISEIFMMMNNELELISREAEEEKRKNQNIEYQYQDYNYKFFNGKLSFNVEFYDSSTISFDNYNNFISIYENRLDEIKCIQSYYSLSYTVDKPGYQDEIITQHLNMYIRENKFEISVKIASRDNNVNKIYEKVKEMILFAPEKYDKTIKRKKIVINKVTFAIGFIPALLIGFILMFVPSIRDVFKQIVVLLPLLIILFAYVIGRVFASILVGDYYNKLITDKKYDYYDADKRKSIYKDDIESYVSKCEVLIGKNSNNMKYRKEIIKYDKMFSKFLLPEIGLLVIIFIISIVF